MSGREVIRLENVSKRYHLGEIGGKTLVEDVSRLVARMRGKPDPLTTVDAENRREESGGEYIWALRDIDLTVSQGQVVGIIGRNGAGKSTLLKLLSRITLPTIGTIKARGRIASLLQVGTGFHPDLTGRENIYLNGAILGMRRHEVTARLEEIVEFSGCAKYVDTPVKRYSTGMTIRLAFAVAAHLDCEILVVDEVLAVGDGEFQRKCIGKMQEVSSGGARTVLFVSHNMSIVSALCERGIVIERGHIVFDGTQDAAIGCYDQQTQRLASVSLAERTDRFGRGAVLLDRVEITGADSNGETRGGGLVCGKPARFTLHFRVPHSGVPQRARFSVMIHHLGAPLLLMSTDFQSNDWPEVSGTGKVAFTLERLPLKRGEYSLSVYADTAAGAQDHVDGATFFDVSDGNFYGSGRDRHRGRGEHTVLVDHDWSIVIDGAADPAPPNGTEAQPLADSN